MESNQELKQSLTDELRDDRRNKLKEHQEFSRLKAFDCNRFIDSDDVLTEKDIAGLCSRIKRRKHASEEDLIRLSNAFIQSELNISAFIKTTGAVNIVVKELTGSDNSRKLLAAQCLCNLSLGDEICCFKLATFAGSYIMILTMESTDAALSVSQMDFLDLIYSNFSFCTANLCLDSAKHCRSRKQIHEYFNVTRSP